MADVSRRRFTDVQIKQRRSARTRAYALLNARHYHISHSKSSCESRHLERGRHLRAELTVGKKGTTVSRRTVLETFAGGCFLDATPERVGVAGGGETAAEVVRVAPLP